LTVRERILAIGIRILAMRWNGLAIGQAFLATNRTGLAIVTDLEAGGMPFWILQ